MRKLREWLRRRLQQLRELLMELYQYPLKDSNYCMMMSEKVLAKEWSNPEENEAWKDL